MAVVASTYFCPFAFQAVIKEKYGQDATNVGDEGGFAPNIQVLETLSLLVNFEFGVVNEYAAVDVFSSFSPFLFSFMVGGKGLCLDEIADSMSDSFLLHYSCSLMFLLSLYSLQSGYYSLK